MYNFSKKKNIQESLDQIKKIDAKITKLENIYIREEDIPTIRQLCDIKHQIIRNIEEMDNLSCLSKPYIHCNVENNKN